VAYITTVVYMPWSFVKRLVVYSADEVMRPFCSQVARPGDNVEQGILLVLLITVVLWAYMPSLVPRTSLQLSHFFLFEVSPFVVIVQFFFLFGNLLSALYELCARWPIELCACFMLFLSWNTDGLQTLPRLNCRVSLVLWSAETTDKLNT